MALHTSPIWNNSCLSCLFSVTGSPAFLRGDRGESRSPRLFFEKWKKPCKWPRRSFFSEGGGQSYIGVRFGAIIQDRRGNVKRRKPKTGARWRKIRSNDLQLKIVAFFGAVGGIRTLVPLLTTTRFPAMFHHDNCYFNIYHAIFALICA